MHPAKVAFIYLRVLILVLLCTILILGVPTSIRQIRMGMVDVTTLSPSAALVLY